MKIPYHKEWFLLEREDYANYLFVSVTWEGYTYLLKNLGFRPGDYMGAEYINSSCNLFELKEPYDQVNKENFEMLFTRPQAWDKLHRLTEKKSKELFAFGRKALRVNATALSDKQLIEWIERFQTAQMWVHVPRGPMFMLETPNALVTNYLLNYLQEKAKDIKRLKTQPNEAFQILTAPTKTSVWAEEKAELARIALMPASRQQKKLATHAQKYKWLEYGLQGKILSADYFTQEAYKIRGAAKTILRSFNHEPKTLATKQKQIFQEYRIHPIHQKIFRIIQDSFYTRLLSKDSQFFGFYAMEHMLREFGRRANLSLEQVRFLTHREFRQVLLKHLDFRNITVGRQRYSLFIANKGQTEYFVGTGARAERKKLKFFSEKQKVAAPKTLQGQPAFPGKIVARVKIVNTIPEMAKMHAGNILVSHMTNPGIVPVMKISAGIITDVGGITSHAAIVARELKKPCVIGTKFATKLLKDGDTVELDADKGMIKLVK